MSDLKTLLVEACVDEIHRVVVNGREKYLCFTRWTDTWMLCATNGTDLWRIAVDIEELESYKDLAGVSSLEAFLTKFRKGFLEGDTSVAMIGSKVTVTIGKGADALTFDLFEAKSAERKTELQSVLFRLADLTSNLQSDLTAANKKIDILKAQKTPTGSGSAFMDLGPKTANQSKAKTNKMGMSAINPTSKKRKAATGVVFD